MNAVALKVNQQKLVDFLAYSFTNKHTVLAELMQNARRAGASHVRFDLEADGSLVVSDDGEGILDLQKLFTIAESGWNEAVQKEEHPFGVGFLSALFAARHVKVESCGRSVAFDTELARRFGKIEVLESSIFPGTRITLSGLDLNPSEIKEALQEYAMGFPIDVILNGEILPSPHRQNGQEVDSEVGRIRLGPDPGYRAYLQGLPVRVDLHRFNAFDAYSVVHLDSGRFFARMPDRDTLLDREAADDQIRKAIAKAWRDTLEAQKSVLPAQEFAERYWSIARTFHIADVMNDVPFLPGQALGVFDEGPRQHFYFGDTYLALAGNGVCLEELRSGRVRLCHSPAEELDGKNFAASIFAWKKGWLVVDRYEIDGGHWAMQHAVDLEKADPDIELLGQVTEGWYKGNYVCARLRLCDAYEIRLGGESVVIDDVALCYEDEDETVIVVPKGSNGAEAVGQACDFCDENDSYMQEDHDEEIEEMQRQISVLRGEDPALTLRKVLERGGCRDYLNLRGKTFAVVIDDSGEVRVSGRDAS